MENFVSYSITLIYGLSALIIKKKKRNYIASIVNGFTRREDTG